MKKYRHTTQQGWTAASIGFTDYYLVMPLNENANKCFIENSKDWELIPNVEVGKIYKKNKLFILIKEVIDADKPNVMAIGFDYAGKWSELNMFLLRSDDIVEATKEEWFERLKEEAIKRGLINGVRFKSACSGSIDVILNGCNLNNGFNLYSNGTNLMDADTGKWATPIVNVQSTHQHTLEAIQRITGFTPLQGDIDEIKRAIEQDAKPGSLTSCGVRRLAIVLMLPMCCYA